MSSRPLAGAVCRHQKIAPAGEMIFDATYTIEADGTRLEMEVTVEWRRRKVSATVVPKPFFNPPRKRG